MVGAPLGRRIATFAFALPFAPFGTLCLRDTRAVGLVVPISVAAMVSKVRFNAEEDDSATVTRHPARSQKSIARLRNGVYVVAAQKLPPTSGGYSAVSARTPAPQESTGLTYHR